MPVVVDETTEYGYVAENRHMARAFLRDMPPDVTFDDGTEVVKLMMTAYMSAEQGRSVPFPPDGLDTFVPAVAQATRENTEVRDFGTGPDRPSDG